MKGVMRGFWVLAVWGLLFSVGCALKTEHKIEAHITIDIRQIRETASNIEDMVSGGGGAPVSKVGPGSWLWPIPNAYAQAPGLKYLTPETQAAIDARKSRFSRIQDLKSQGLIGENNQGLLEGRGEATPEASELVRGENADRDLIYRTIVEQNGLPADEIAKVRRAFAEEQRDRARSGDWVQTPDGAWVQK